uniref:CHK kinase-like domain-containing protein n=1 Tax=Anopheles atroparvus TaxID=41427 RepID=A0AAG5CV28_ANOAO
MSSSKKDPSRWLSGQLFQKALVQHTADRGLEVEDVHLALHGNAAQQYASTIYRATVSYRSRGKTESIKLIVKLMTSKVNSVADESSFDTELSVYRDVLPKMQATQGETDDNRFSPKLIYAANEPQPHIILEDLMSRQYEHHNELLGTEDSKAVLIKLARFHATSYSLGYTVKDRAAVNNGLFQQKPSEGVKFMLENFSIFAEELSRWDGYGKYAERLRNMQPRFIERGIQIYEGTKAGFSTNLLNHGDFHFNNMLFQFDNDQRVANVIFYDYQLSCWTTPAVDLLYFFYLVCNRETRETKRDELVQLYHQEFTSTLALLGFMGNGPSLLDINCDLLRAGFLEVAIVVCFIPFLFADYNQAINVYSNEEDARAYRRKLYNNEEYQALIKPLLTSFLHKGFLD